MTTSKNLKTYIPSNTSESSSPKLFGIPNGIQSRPDVSEKIREAMTF